MNARLVACVLFTALLAGLAPAQDASPLAGTSALPTTGDLSAKMVEGIHAFLTREIERAAAERSKLWARDVSSAESYVQSIKAQRERFQRMIGAVDARLPAGFEYVASPTEPALVEETARYTVHAVRWQVFEGVHAEGLWLQPKGPAVACIVAVPDADQTPEMVAGLAAGLGPETQFARRLAENGCQVLVPTLIDRKDTWSGNDQLHRFTNLPHREWIYRQAFELGRHIIGYEVQKILAAVDWFEAEAVRTQT